MFIYITKLASNEVFATSNKIHREVGRAKDLSAPRYMHTYIYTHTKNIHVHAYINAYIQHVYIHIHIHPYIDLNKFTYKIMIHREPPIQHKHLLTTVCSVTTEVP